MPDQPRRFYFQRHEDVTGASGTGQVADGVLWPDGSADVRWRGPRPSAVHWDRFEDAVAIHGHGGATQIVWLDPEPAAPLVASTAPVPAELRDRIAEALMRWSERNSSPQYASMRRPETVRANAYSRADAVLSELPAPDDRAAILREAANVAGECAEEMRGGGGEMAQDREAGAVYVSEALFRLAAEAQPTEVVHGCPPDGSGLTPCCGRTPFELPLTDRISSEAPTTCPGRTTAGELE
ncbi:hypothetical protein ABZ404_36965 [Streptomyces sp. NPDC005878]|uniref:hypothetical protein n=1 Tax=Streptomyces sp. NPDC005878 TaxID=3157077 RepID=UPI0033D2DD74